MIVGAGIGSTRSRDESATPPPTQPTSLPPLPQALPERGQQQQPTSFLAYPEMVTAVANLARKVPPLLEKKWAHELRTEHDRASWGSGGNADVVVISMAPACWRTNASSHSTIDYMVRKTTQMTAIHAKRSAPHSRRRTSALRALRVQGNVVKVAKLLGHASGTTTGRYLDHLALGELRSTMPALPGAE